MDISSFKEFLRTGKPTAADYTRSLHNMVTGVSRHTIGGREDDLNSFRESMAALAANLHEQASSLEIETTVGHALELLRDFNDRAVKFNNTHNTELKAVMRTMTETITFLSESRTRSVHQLQFMERELEQASQIDDLRLLRTRLIHCLDAVRDETVRLQNESQARSNEVRLQLDRASQIHDMPVRFGAMDMVTGLPSRRSAERAIAEAMMQDNDHAAAVFVVKKLAAINTKYTRAIGDEVMLRAANHFAQHLSAATFLYRWSGPALVALIDTNGNPEEVRRLWTRAAAVKQEISFDSQQRTVFVLVETAILFHVITQGSSPEELFHRMDQFVTEQGDGTAEENLLPQ